jgi:protein ImuA
VPQNEAADALILLRRRIAAIAAHGQPIVPSGGSARVQLGHLEVDQATGGLARAAVHEVFAGQGADAGAATGFALALAGRFLVPARPWLWICQDFAGGEWGDLYGPGLADYGLDPGQLIVATSGKGPDVLRVAEEALRCSSLGVVVIETLGDLRQLDLTASRRLALAAGENGPTAVLLRLAADPAPSAAMTRWLVGSLPGRSEPGFDHGGTVACRPCFDAALIRNRQGRTGRWIMEWNSDDRALRPPTTFLKRIPTPLAERAPAPPMADSALRDTG